MTPTEKFRTPMSDGSTQILTISHHDGCPGRWPCACSPIKTSDRHYPRAVR